MEAARAMEEALDSEMTPDSEIMLASDMALDSVEMAPDSVDVVPDSVRMAPDSVEMAPYSVDVVPDSVEMAPDSINVVPDSVEVMPESLCARYGTFHADNDEEGCYQARREASRCARCGIVTTTGWTCCPGR